MSAIADGGAAAAAATVAAAALGVECVCRRSSATNTTQHQMPHTDAARVCVRGWREEVHLRVTVSVNN